ncbi:hypothetical protein [Nonomuraea dietziae]|uniref:hypothetical protein n=1 Tax=Nonomuraea dietziae TaxID=65515 RepID=UPI0031D502E6
MPHDVQNAFAHRRRRAGGGAVLQHARLRRRRDGPAPCAQLDDQRGWGQPVWCAEFDDFLDPNEWAVYDSPGHAGNGRRSPGQLFLGDGALFLYGTPDGTTAGLAARYTQQYGRWETRIRLYPGAGSYHPVALLWPGPAAAEA